MPSSVIDSGDHQERVGSYLRAALPECRLTSEPLVSGYPPLLLMWMTHVMAAFAFSNGDTSRSYDALYRSFKNYYSENRGRLDEFDLSFVFCVRADVPNLEEFSSKVETDVYFCRKFVVALVPRLEQSFDRLPFLPLTSAAGGSGRPPSAQTYMQQCGVPATLAKYLAVPHQRGPENIVRECIENKSNWTPMLASRGDVNVPQPEVERDTERVRLESLCIQSFRAYKRPQTFELGEAVTVLYGPNGFGKTSFFDAIDFVATGGVGRLGLSPSSDRFGKAVAHLDGARGDAAVSLTFGANGARRRIRREVVSRMHARLDDVNCDRKTALVEITGGGVTPADRIEHLVSLFRATHLFSQERLELAKEFDRDCALPPHVVAHMLAFEDYANARSKGVDVCEVLGGRIASGKREIAALKSEVDEGERTVRRLGEPSGGYGKAATPAEALQSLRRRVQEAGLSVESAKLDAVFVRACRAAIQARLAEGKGRVARLTGLVEQVRGLPAVADGLARLEDRRARVEAELKTVEVAAAEAEEALREADVRSRQLGERRSRLGNAAGVVRWVRETRPRYEELVGRETRSAEAVAEGLERLRGLREERSGAVRALQRKEEEATALAAKLESARLVNRELGELARAGDAWPRDRSRIRELKTERATCVQRLSGFQEEEKAASLLVRANRSRRSEVEHKVNEIEHERSELAGLLSKVEGHVEDGCCPLCGHDHGSAKELLSRIGERQVHDAASGLRNELGDLLDAKEEVEQRWTQAREAVERERETLGEMNSEVSACESRVASFESAARRLGLAAEEPTAVMREIHRRMDRSKSDIAEMEDAGSTLREETQQAAVTKAATESRIGEAEGAVKEAQRELEDCRGEIAALRGDSRAEQVALDTASAQVEELERRHGEELRRVESAMSAQMEAAGKSGELKNTRRQKASALKSTLDGLRREIGTRRRTVAEAHGQLKECGLGTAAKETEVMKLLEAETRTNGRLAELRGLADSVEVAMDTATTAAALQEQRQAIRWKARRIEKVSEDIEVQESWLRYFREVIDKVSARQHAAIRSFAEECGPMASAIQRRLRSVYGFEGVDTRSHEATIRVRVRRGEEVLRPTDYFSHSQQQTLFLGLFLTTRLSQTWSSLSTVLLDDPVTHFDDLNTYAFLDMIIGLLNAQSGPQQFVMSTCDEKVFQLARSKFRHLGEAARFYGFSAIGADGPVVEGVAPV